MFDNRIVTALIVVVGVPLATVAYVALIEWILERLPYRVRTRLRPWLWVIPALLVMASALGSTGRTRTRCESRPSAGRTCTEPPLAGVRRSRSAIARPSQRSGRHGTAPCYRFGADRSHLRHSSAC